MGGLVLYLVGVVAGCVLLARVPRLPTAAATSPGAAPARSCSVVVPARNEERRIGPLLTSLQMQRRSSSAPLEVVVVDDGSTDATAAMAASAGTRVVTAPSLPSGWAGKPWACHTGAAASSGDVLVFVDADVVLEPAALDALEAVQGRHGGLVSVQPWHDARRPYEKLSLFPNVLALMGSGACTPFGHRVRPAAAFGPVLAVDRATYDAIGGHAAVRGEVAEDIALGRRAPRLLVVGGRGTARFRMYPEGPASLVEGWTKNLAAGLGATPWWATVLAVAWVWSLAGGWAASPWCYPVSAAQVWWMGRRVGRYGPVTAALYAVPLAVFVVLLVRSLVRRATGRPVSWRGRRLRA